MTITRQLLITVLFALLALIVVGGQGLWQQHQANGRFDYLKANTFPSIHTLDDAKEVLADMRLTLARSVALTDPAAQAAQLAQMAELDKRFDTSLGEYEKNLLSGDAERQLLQADRDAMQAYRQLRDKFQQLRQANNVAGADACQVSPVCIRV